MQSSDLVTILFIVVGGLTVSAIAMSITIYNLGATICAG